MIAKLLQQSFSEHHASVPTRYDLASGTLISTGTTPEELLRYDFLTSSDAPTVKRNTKASIDINIDAVLQTFREKLGKSKPAVWA